MTTRLMSLRSHFGSNCLHRTHSSQPECGATIDSMQMPGIMVDADQEDMHVGDEAPIAVVAMADAADVELPMLPIAAEVVVVADDETELPKLPLAVEVIAEDVERWHDSQPESDHYDFYGRPIPGVEPPRHDWRYWADSQLKVLGPPFGSDWVIATRGAFARRDGQPLTARDRSRSRVTWTEPLGRATTTSSVSSPSCASAAQPP